MKYYRRALGALWVGAAFEILAALATWKPGYAPTFIHYPGVPDPFGLRRWLSASSGLALNLNFAAVVALGFAGVAALGLPSRFARSARIARALAALVLSHFLLLDAVFYREGLLAILVATGLAAGGRVFPQLFLALTLVLKGAGACQSLIAVGSGGAYALAAWLALALAALASLFFIERPRVRAAALALLAITLVAGLARSEEPLYYGWAILTLGLRVPPAWVRRGRLRLSAAIT